MVETISPAVCGSRRRHVTAIALFAIGAVLASAAVGAAAAALGDAVGVLAIVAAVAIAALGALRESDLVRLPLPQLRHQVPERWHRELPLPVWTLGYGLGLGAGLLTYQPVATLLAALCACAALASPLTAAVCMTSFGAGRVIAAALPAAAVERLPRLRRPMRRMNAAVLAASALALAAAPAAHAGALALGGGSQLDPAARPSGTLAYAQRDGAQQTVVVRRAGGAGALRFRGAASPALDGGRVAYADAAGVHVVELASGREVLRLRGRWEKPAVSWPHVAAVLVTATQRRLYAFDGPSGRRRLLSTVAADDDLGRPSLDGWQIAWHQVTQKGSLLMSMNLRTGRRQVLRRSRTVLFANPVVIGSRLAWVEQRLGVSRLMLGNRLARRGRMLLVARGDLLLWTTCTDGRAVYVTRWNVAAGVARIVRVRMRAGAR